jgi:hypothetical protein
MDSYTAVGLAEGFIEADSEEQVIEAWQYLHDTRLAYQLQGFFGRTAQHLLAEGIIVDNSEENEMSNELNRIIFDAAIRLATRPPRKWCRSP